MSAPAKETIYLFTTTRSSLYRRDLLNVCCFPEGWTVEFGYKPEYVSQGLVLNLSEKLNGHPVVIVFCEAVREGDVFYRYYPVRKGTIGEARKDFSDCLTLPIKLGPVFNYSSSECSNRVDDFQKFVAESDQRPQTLNSERFTKKANIFVRSDRDCFPAEFWQPWDRYWYPLAARLCDRKGLADSYFVRLDPQCKSSPANRGHGFPSAVIDGGGRPKWALAAGESYELRLEVRTKAKPPHLIPAVVSRDEMLHAVGPFERQSGDGTEVEYILAPKRSFQTEYGLFEVRVEPDKDGIARSSEIGGVLVIKPTRWLLTRTISCLVAGAALLSLDSALLEDWFGKPDGQSYWHGKSALGAAKILGSALFGVGCYLGFRRLPMKS